MNRTCESRTWVMCMWRW